MLLGIAQVEHRHKKAPRREEGLELRAVGQQITLEGPQEVLDELARAGLFALPIERQRLVAQGLQDEVGDDAPILRVHPRPIGVEDAHQPHVHAELAAVFQGQGLGRALAFVVATAHAQRVDVAPVALRLRVDLRVAIDFAGRGDEEPRTAPPGHLERLARAVEGRSEGVEAVGLVVRGRGGAGQVEDPIVVARNRLAHIALQ